MTNKYPLTEYINVRVGRTDKARLCKVAAERGEQVSAYVRDAVLARAGGLTSENRSNLRRLLGDLGRVGNNINQLTKLSWRGAAIDRLTLDALTVEFRAMRQQVREALS